MTLEKYINERFIDSSENDFLFVCTDHPMTYMLISKRNNQKYVLCIKESGDNPYYYADEIIAQGAKQFIYHKKGYRHYCIRDIDTGEEWEIPKKDTCVSVCKRLNLLNKKSDLDDR